MTRRSCTNSLLLGLARQKLGLAQVHLWSRHYDKALALYRKMLRDHPEVKDYYAGYIDAAASAKFRLIPDVLSVLE